MNLSAWTLIFLVFIVPAVSFLAAFEMSARCRRSVQADGVTGILPLFVIALLINLILLSLDQVFAADALKDFAEAMVAAPCANGADIDGCEDALKEALSTAWTYGAAAITLSAVSGALLSKLIVWGVLPFGFYYGPLYPIIKGFFRRHIIVTVVSKVVVKTEKMTEESRGGGAYTMKSGEKTELPVMYRGRLDELRLDHKGRIEYVSLLGAGKALFVPPKAESKVKQHARDYFVAIGEDERAIGVLSEDEHLRRKNELRDQVSAQVAQMAHAKKMKMLEPRLVIEGEDIQNVFLAQVGQAPIDQSWRRLKQFVLARGAILAGAILVVALVVGAFILGTNTALAPSLP